MKSIIGSLVLVCALSGCASPPEPGPASQIPQADLSGMEPLVVRVLTETREAVVQDPGSAESWGRLGAAHQAHGLFDLAEPCYRRAAELAPEDFRWAYFLAIVRGARGAGPEELTELFESAAGLQSDYPPVHVRLGRTSLAHGRPEDAERFFRRAVELAPDFAAAQSGLGQSLLALDRPEQAVEALEAAAQLDDRDGAIYAMLAQAYTRLERPGPARAAESRSRALRVTAGLDDPLVVHYVHSMGASARHWFSRARDRIARGDFDEAIRDLRTVQQVRPEDADVFYLLGQAQDGTGLRGAAKVALDRALELNPEHAPALVALARIVAEEGEPDQALEYLRRASEAAPDDPTVLAALSPALAERGDLEGAVAACERLAVLAPDNPRVAFNLGTLLARQGDLPGAERQFRRAVELDSEYSEARDRLAVVVDRRQRQPGG